MEDDLQAACEILAKGGIILYPTDTIWGLGCDAGNKEAVARIYNIKRRVDSKSMLVLLDSLDSLEKYVAAVPDAVPELLAYATKPTTIIYPGAKNVAPNLIAEDGSLGIRITKEAFSNRLCSCFGKPLVSTSANISGEASPLCFEDISKEVIDAVDYVVKYRQDDTSTSSPSSILKINKDDSITIIRK